MTQANKKSRSKSREVSLQVFFALSNNKEQNVETVINRLFDHDNEFNENIDETFVKNTISGINNNLEEIDNTISKYLKEDWRIERLSQIDLAILRLAINEIKYEENIPLKVSVNEALNLSHLYSDEKSYEFINGVLGKVIKNETA